MLTMPANAVVSFSAKNPIPTSAPDDRRIASDFHYIENLFYCAYYCNLETFHGRLSCYDQMARYVDLVVDLATYSSGADDNDGGNNTFSTDKLDGFVIRDLTEDELIVDHDCGVVIEISGKQHNFMGVSLRGLQRKFREDIIAHTDFYLSHVPLDEHEGSMRCVKARLAFDDMELGLVKGIRALIKASPERVALFVENSKPIIEALAQYDRYRQFVYVIVNQSTNPALVILTERALGVELKMAGEKVIIENESLSTLRSKLCKDVLDNPTHYSETTISFVNCLEVGWDGGIYNKGSSLSPVVNKSHPYMPIPTGFRLLNLNGEASVIPDRMDNPKYRIFCRHLAAQYIKDSFWEPTGRGKVDWRHYQSISSIGAHIPKDLEIHYEALLANGKRYDLINNDTFGEHISACFLDMQSPGKQETLRLLMIESTGHVMAMRLRIKFDGDAPIYVVNFFDPNKTNVAMRCQADDLWTWEGHTLARYINGSDTPKKGDYYGYYAGDEPISLIIECDPDIFIRNSTKVLKGTNAARRLTTFAAEPLTATHVHFLLEGNFAAELAGLYDTLKEKSQDELVTLLSAKNKYGVSGLSIALLDGHIESMHSFAKLLELVTDVRQRVDLINIKDSQETPAISKALDRGNANVVKAYGEMLKLIPDDTQRARLLAAKNLYGVPGLVYAIKNGRVQAVKAYGDLLKLIDSEKLRGELVAVSDEVGIPGLALALNVGDREVIMAYGELLAAVASDELRAKLIVAKYGDDTAWIYFAIHTSYEDAVEVFRELLKTISDDHLRSRLLSIFSLKLACFRE